MGGDAPDSTWGNGRARSAVYGLVFRVVTEGVFVREGVSPFAVLVFAAVGLVGFLRLVSVGSEAGPASETTVASIDGALVPKPPPIESFDSLSWSRVSADPAIFGRSTFMVSATAGGGRAWSRSAGFCGPLLMASLGTRSGTTWQPSVGHFLKRSTA